MPPSLRSQPRLSSLCSSPPLAPSPQPESISQYHSALNKVREREEKERTEKERIKEKEKEKRKKQKEKSRSEASAKSSKPLKTPSYSFSTLPYPPSLAPAVSGSAASTLSSSSVRSPSPSPSSVSLVSTTSSFPETTHIKSLTSLIQRSPNLATSTTIAVVYKKNVYKVLSFNSIGSQVEIEPLYGSDNKSVKSKECRVVKYVKVEEDGRVGEGTGEGGMVRVEEEEREREQEGEKVRGKRGVRGGVRGRRFTMD